MRGPLEDEVELLELEAELAARQEDIAAGRIPATAWRSLFPHELVARTNFAEIAAALDQAGLDIEVRLRLDRDAFLELLEVDLATQPDPPALLARLQAIDGPAGIVSVAGARKLLREAEGHHRGVLQALARGSARRVHEEAAGQGVATAAEQVTLDEDAKVAIDAQATRLAQGPLIDLVRSLRERAFLEAAAP